MKSFDSNFRPSLEDCFCFDMVRICFYEMKDLQVKIWKIEFYICFYIIKGDLPSSSLFDPQSQVNVHGFCICLVFQTALSLSRYEKEIMAMLARLCVLERPALSCFRSFIFILCTVLGCHALPRSHTTGTSDPAATSTTPGSSVTINYDPSDGRILGSTLSSCKFNSSASEKCDVHVRHAARWTVNWLVQDSQTKVVYGLVVWACEFADKQTQSLV